MQHIIIFSIQTSLNSFGGSLYIVVQTALEAIDC